MMLASTQQTLLIKKSIVSSFKLQQASEGKSFYFILAGTCICKHLCLKDIEAYIEGSGWGLLHPEHCEKEQPFLFLCCTVVYLVSSLSKGLPKVWPMSPYVP